MEQHRVAMIASVCLLVAGMISLRYGLRRPVWVRLDYGRRRYHGVSALVQGVPMYRGVPGANVHEDEPAGRAVPVCILDRATIEEINWAQAWRDLDNRLEETARGVDARLDASWPEMMGIYRTNASNMSFILNKVQQEDFAGLMRADTGALRVMFAEVDAHLAEAARVQAN